MLFLRFLNIFLVCSGKGGANTKPTHPLSGKYFNIIVKQRVSLLSNAYVCQ